jgi:hypothetical protein
MIRSLQRFKDQALVQKWASGPASLPWNRLALELIVKYQQNPLRAARVLAHMHAAAHDAIVGLAATSSEEASPGGGRACGGGGVLAHFYPRESPGRLEGDRDRRDAGRRRQRTDVAADARFRARSGPPRRRRGDPAGARRWRRCDLEPGGSSAPAAHVWRAAPPLNLSNPSEPLAGKWRTWALADGREIQPPPPPPFGSERYWEEAREVLQVSRP